MINQTDEKIKTLINDILKQCEDQGLSEDDVKQLPDLLRIEIRKVMTKKSLCTKFRR